MLKVDAQAMYTNMNTKHAISYIAYFIRTSPMYREINKEAVVNALKIVMNKYIFKFRDTYWS